MTNYDLPAWAKQSVRPDGYDFFEVRRLYHQGRAQLQLPELKALKGWAKAHGWPTPLFGFKEAFIAKLFEGHESFALALNESGIKLDIPIKEHTLTIETLQKWDALYEGTEDAGVLGRRATGWASLVSELRELRHLVEMGIKVKVEGTDTVLTSWQSFYAWAHGRYHMLEDGADSWIGDDDS